MTKVEVLFGWQDLCFPMEMINRRSYDTNTFDLDQQKAMDQQRGIIGIDN